MQTGRSQLLEIIAWFLQMTNSRIDTLGTRKRYVQAILVLSLGFVAVSTASTLIKLAQQQATPVAVAAWRLTIASLILTPIALTRCRQEWKHLSRKDWMWLVVSGVALAYHFYTWITSLAMTTVAASVVLVSMTPIFVGIISYILLKEQLSRMAVVGIVVAVIGAVIIGVTGANQGAHHWQGDLLALAGALTVAIYMIIGRHLRSKLSVLAYIYPVYGTAAVTLMLIALISGVPMWDFSSATWGWLILIAIGPQLLGHSSYNWALGHLPTIYVSLAALAEPIGATLIAWWALGEAPGLFEIAGGVCILVGIAIASRQNSKS